MSTPIVGTATIVLQHQSDQLLGGTQFQKMVELGAITNPSQVYFQTRIPAAGFNREDAQIFLDVIAQLIEETMGGPYIVDMSYYQDTTKAGHLLDVMQVFWETQDGQNDGWRAFVLAKISPELVNPCIQNAVAAALGQPTPYPDADCSLRGFAPGTGPTFPPGGIPHQ